MEMPRFVGAPGSSAEGRQDRERGGLRRTSFHMGRTSLGAEGAVLHFPQKPQGGSMARPHPADTGLVLYPWLTAFTAGARDRGRG